MKRGTITFIAGVLTGAVAFGGTAAAAAGITANPSADRVFVGGNEIKCDVYKVGGNNYFKLRDIAAIVDFSVVYDSGRVFIDPSRGYDADEKYTVEPAAGSTDEMRTEVIRLINAERAKAGLPELKVLPALMNSAQSKAQDFKDSGYYGHTSPVYGTFGEMIRSFVPKAKTVAEIIAPRNKTPKDAVACWTDSPPHNEIMRNPKLTHIGAGVIEGVNGGFWWVAQFVSLEP